jgi:hypothetical protein
MRLASVSLFFILLVACNAKVANVLESTPTDGGTGTGTGAGTGSSSQGAVCETAAECNDNPAISAQYGRCENGRCVCITEMNPSQAPFTPRGKCGPEAPVCTVGQDQTCNASPEMSALAGRCVNGTCQCNGSFVKNFAGKCGAAPSPSATSFPDLVPGLWLIGWSGGLDHFSWVRFTGNGGSMSGTAFLRSRPSARKGMTPYFSCTGEGSWLVSAKPKTIFITFPGNCPPEALQNIQASYTFGTISSSPTFVKTALLQVDFEHEPAQQALIGLKFPDDTCDATLTQCADPFVE